MKSSLQIEKSVEKWPIGRIASQLGLSEDQYDYHGKYIAKIQAGLLRRVGKNRPGRLVLVTAMTPTPAGEGKTTTTIGLGDAFASLGLRSSICLREPSLGPFFGIKGGGTGSGYAQVVPAEDINLHFTGDMYSVTKANNLLSAMIDNHLQHGNTLAIDPRRITWKRVIDLNDRALREIFVGLGGVMHGIPRKDGFDITPASEVMAILCLALDYPDMIERLTRIIIGSTYRGEPVSAHQIKAEGAMAVLLRDAIHPNLVQTLAHTPAFVHGGAFANIAHGCNSAVATKLACALSDIVVTEAGFGSELGAEKFFNIKCRVAGLTPAAAGIVATVRAVAYQGCDSLARGMDNLRIHIENVRRFGIPAVVAINRFEGDRGRDIAAIVAACERMGIAAVPSTVRDKGARGGIDLAKAVLRAIGRNRSRFKFLYPLRQPLKKKIETIAKAMYGACCVDYERSAELDIELIEKLGYGALPICMAKTQASLSDNPSLRGRPRNFRITVRQVKLAAGAGFVIAITGTIMTMPGLPRFPAAERIRIDHQGRLISLS
ncbi:MAG: formate--tetrahydrofolate ligase [Candidatus Aureabacteria bacterium]|nr:formate--tetrahydrofolate ligase [Candidatus Auribacterota bacterium]